MAMMTGKQTSPAASSRKSTSAHASPDPEGGGTSRSKQINESRGEGAGRKEKDNEKARGHEHLIISSPAPHIKRASHHAPAAASHPRNPHDAIPLPSHHGASSRLRRITSEPFPFPPPLHTYKAWPRPPPAVGMTPSRQASSPVGSPSPDTKSGAMKRDDEGRTENDEARTTGNITRWVSKQTAETDDIPMTSPERARHDQR